MVTIEDVNSTHTDFEYYLETYSPSVSYCSGIPDCKFCIEAMYPKRTIYVKTWFAYYIANYEDIKLGNKMIPRLDWYCGPGYKTFNRDDFIKIHHRVDDKFIYFLDNFYPDVENWASLDSIFNLYRSTKKIYC